MEPRYPGPRPVREKHLPVPEQHALRGAGRTRREEDLARCVGVDAARGRGSSGSTSSPRASSSAERPLARFRPVVNRGAFAVDDHHVLDAGEIADRRPSPPARSRARVVQRVDPPEIAHTDEDAWLGAAQHRCRFDAAIACADRHDDRPELPDPVRGRRPLPHVRHPHAARSPGCTPSRRSPPATRSDWGAELGKGQCRITVDDGGEIGMLQCDGATLPGWSATALGPQAGWYVHFRRGGSGARLRRAHSQRHGRRRRGRPALSGRRRDPRRDHRESGRVRAPCDAELDAGGLIVAPGFVDLHTHYDAQVFWDPYCSLSGWHGVTSVVSATAASASRRCGPRCASGRC